MNDWLFYTLEIGGVLFFVFALIMAIRERFGK